MEAEAYFLQTRNGGHRKASVAQEPYRVLLGFSSAQEYRLGSLPSESVYIFVIWR